MNALPNDIQQYIYGKVDKTEHIKALFDSMTDEDKVKHIKMVLSTMNTPYIAKVGRDVEWIIRETRQMSYDDFKKEWVSMKKENKRLGVERNMYMRFDSLITDYMVDWNVVIKVDKFALGYVYASRFPEGRFSYKKMTEVEQCSSFWIE